MSGMSGKEAMTSLVLDRSMESRRDSPRCAACRTALVARWPGVMSATRIWFPSWCTRLEQWKWMTLRSLGCMTQFLCRTSSGWTATSSDVSKGDALELNYRSRLMGRECSAGRDIALYTPRPNHWRRSDSPSAMLPRTQRMGEGGRS